MPEDVAAQARQSLDNVKAIVEAAGLKVGDIVKTTVFVKDLNDFATVNAAYEAFSASIMRPSGTFLCGSGSPAERCENRDRSDRDSSLSLASLTHAPLSLRRVREFHYSTFVARSSFSSGYTAAITSSSSGFRRLVELRLNRRILFIIQRS